MTPAPPQPPAAPGGFAPFPGAVVVHRARRKRDARDAELTLVSLGIPHRTLRDGQDFVLVVPADHAARAGRELEAWRVENVGWPPQERRVRALSDGYAGAAVYVALLVAVHVLQVRGGFGVDWDGLGRTDGTLVREGEWWRAFTSLSLHSGLRHLVSNLFFGVLFGALSAHVLGTGLGWAAILLAGGLGNLLNVWVQPATHLSIGASTAVFGALGVLVACQWTQQLKSRRRWLAILAGFVLVAWLGVPEQAIQERVDFMAHITGFAAGLVLGLGAARWVTHGTVSQGLQRLLAALALALVPACWALALILGA